MAHCDYDEMITKWLRNVSVCYVRILSWLRVWVIIRKRFAKTRADSNWVREKKIMNSELIRGNNSCNKPKKMIFDVKWIHEINSDFMVNKRNR